MTTNTVSNTDTSFSVGESDWQRAYERKERNGLSTLWSNKVSVST